MLSVCVYPTFVYHLLVIQKFVKFVEGQVHFVKTNNRESIFKTPSHEDHLQAWWSKPVRSGRFDRFNQEPDPSRSGQPIELPWQRTGRKTEKPAENRENRRSTGSARFSKKINFFKNSKRRRFVYFYFYFVKKEAIEIGLSENRKREKVRKRNPFCDSNNLPDSIVTTPPTSQTHILPFRIPHRIAMFQQVWEINICTFVPPFLLVNLSHCSLSISLTKVCFFVTKVCFSLFQKENTYVDLLKLATDLFLWPI